MNVKIYKGLKSFSKSNDINENHDIANIVQEILAGYMFGERLLRPSMVAVSKKVSNKNKENEGKKWKKDPQNTL